MSEKHRPTGRKHASSANEELPVESETGASVKPRNWYWWTARIAHGLLMAMFLVFVLIQLLMRAWGDAIMVPIQNMVTYAQMMVATVCVIGWWFLFAPVSRTMKFAIGLPVIALLVGWWCSVRRLDFDGDMNARIEFFWEESAADRLAVHLEKSSTADIEQIDSGAANPFDMPTYRGIHRDGVVIGPDLRTDWEAHPPTELWRHPCGGGYSSFSIVGRQLITMEQRGENEVVVCYDADSGLEFWTFEYPSHFVEALGGPGPRSTPTIHDGAVYSFGTFGDLFKLDLKTGEKIWHVNSLQQFQLPNTTWAMTSSPLIIEGANTVVVNIGGLADEGGKPKPGGGLVAYELETGDLVWHGTALGEPQTDLTEFKVGNAAIEGLTGASVPGYSSPMLATLAGTEVILNFDGVAFRGHNPETGEEYWSYEFKAGDYISVAQPIVLNSNSVLISASYFTGTMTFDITHDGKQLRAIKRWDEPSTELRSKMSTPVYYNDYIYGLDEGMMVCFDPRDGTRKWKGRRGGSRGKYGHGQMLLANGKIIVLTEQGQLVLINPNPKELTELGVVQVLNEDIKTWNPLAMAYGKVFVRNAEEVACYDLQVSSE